MNKLTLVVTTYERPDALAAVLRSIARQSRPPDEIIVADDGSGETTARVAEAAARVLPLSHVRFPHDGFRAGRMRNLGLALAGGDYVVFIDDDILLHPDFIKDHIEASRPGFFIQGSRALLDAGLTETAIAAEDYWPGFFAPGVGGSKNLLRSNLLSSIFSRKNNGLRGIRTCNFALWREDAARVNGFYEGFVGWGREDSEFAARLLNAGVRRRNLRFAALCCHLWHPPRARDRLKANDTILSETVGKKLVWRDNGMDSHMAPAESRRQP